MADEGGDDEASEHPHRRRHDDDDGAEEDAKGREGELRVEEDEEEVDDDDDLTVPPGYETYVPTKDSAEMMHELVLLRRSRSQGNDQDAGDDASMSDSEDRFEMVQGENWLRLGTKIMYAHTMRCS